VRLELEPPGKDLRVKHCLEGDAVRWKEERKDAWSVIGAALGASEIEFRIADRKTLLSTIVKRSVQVVPASQP
jgi:hypothetical protein